MERPDGGSYYSILGIHRCSSLADIKAAYRKLAMQWHPDRYARMPWLMEEAKRRFQQIKEAYQVLSDPAKRTMYDAGLYCGDEEDEDFMGFMREMSIHMEKVRAEGKIYTMEDLQYMFHDMVRGFGFCETWNLQPGYMSSLFSGNNVRQTQIPTGHVFGGTGFCNECHFSSLQTFL